MAVDCAGVGEGCGGEVAVGTLVGEGPTVGEGPKVGVDVGPDGVDVGDCPAHSGTTRCAPEQEDAV